MLAIIGLSFGALAASGVLTVLLAVGLLPRYIGRLHEAKHIIWFENLVVLGTLLGALVSVLVLPKSTNGLGMLGTLLEIMYGLFAGVFVGTLAIAIAEMLDSLPIFARRVSLRHGVGIVVLSIAMGKLIGAILYFVLELHRTAG